MQTLTAVEKAARQDAWSVNLVCLNQSLHPHIPLHLQI
jgi:hypothetical protein